MKQQQSPQTSTSTSTDSGSAEQTYTMEQVSPVSMTPVTFADGAGESHTLSLDDADQVQLASGTPLLPDKALEATFNGLDDTRKAQVTAFYDRARSIMAEVNGYNRQLRDNAVSDADKAVIKPKAVDAANRLRAVLEDMKGPLSAAGLYNVDFEKAAILFEDNLGRLMENDGRPKQTIEAMCRRIKTNLVERAKVKSAIPGVEKTIAELTADCGGKPGETYIAGNVGQDEEAIMGVLDGGNLRERMTLSHHFVEKVLGADMVSQTKDATLQSRLDEIMKEAKLNRDVIDAQREDKSGGGDAGDMSGGSMVWHEPENGDYRQHRDRGTRTVGQGDSTTDRTVADVGREDPRGRSSPLSEREKEYTGKSAEDDVLTWSEGAKRLIMNECDEWVKENRMIGLPLRAGVSGHTTGFMRTAEYFGVSAANMRLACIGYLLPIRAHTLVEVLLAAAGYGIPYTNGHMMYRDVAPVGEAALRSCGGGKFPDEVAPPREYKTGQVGANVPGV